MPETATTTTTSESAAASPTAADTSTDDAAKASTATTEVKSDEFKSEESKKSVLADLAKERDARQALEKKFEDQQKAFAAALGLTEEPKSGDELTETVKSLQEQFAASQLEATRLRIAAEFKIPAEHHDLLTETDPEKLSAQAEKVGALVAAHAAAAGTPAFQPNPGQGQGGGSATPEAQAEAEYAKFYPPSK